MDFTLSKEHEMARALFREFAEKEVKPLAIEVDETEVFPRETVEKMAKAGFMGIPVPKEYGGQGCDILTYAMCVEELAKVCGTTAVIVSAHTSLHNAGQHPTKKSFALIHPLASKRHGYNGSFREILDCNTYRKCHGSCCRNLCISRQISCKYHTYCHSLRNIVQSHCQYKHSCPLQLTLRSFCLLAVSMQMRNHMIQHQQE